MCFRAKIMFEIFLRSYSRIFEDTDTGYLSQSEGKSTHNWVTERLHFYNINARAIYIHMVHIAHKGENTSDGKAIS
jgi:hypothetical protein